MERAERISSGSTLRTPLTVLSTIGQRQEYTTIDTFDVSPIPRISTKTGRIASGAVLRKTSSNGLSISATPRYQPMTSPSGTPTTIAMINPPRARAPLAKRCACNSPVASMPASARKTSEKGGRKVESTQPRRGSTSQRPRKTRIAMLLRNQRAASRASVSAKARGSEIRASACDVLMAFSMLRAVDYRLQAYVSCSKPHMRIGRYVLCMDQLPDTVPQADELGCRSQVFPRAAAFKPDIERIDYPPGTGRHHQHPLAEVDRFFYAVRNENDGLAGLLPDAQQLVLQSLAGLRVERCKRLVHEQHLRVVRQGARNCNPLLHAARQLMRIAIRERSQSDQIKIMASPLGTLRLGYALRLKTELNIALRRLPRKQCVLLEYNA